MKIVVYDERRLRARQSVWYGGSIIPEATAKAAHDWVPKPRFAKDCNVELLVLRALSVQAYCFEHFGRWPEVNIILGSMVQLCLEFDDDRVEYTKFLLRFGQ